MYRNTLIPLLAVLAIIAILAAVLFPTSRALDSESGNGTTSACVPPGVFYHNFLSLAPKHSVRSHFGLRSASIAHKVKNSSQLLQRQPTSFKNRKREL